MDNFSISTSYKKNNRSVETQSTINNNITVVTPESSIDIDMKPRLDGGSNEVRPETRPKILPPKHMLRASAPVAEEANDLKEYPPLTYQPIFSQTVIEESIHVFEHKLK